MDIEIRAEAVMEGRDYLALTRFMTGGKNKNSIMMNILLLLIAIVGVYADFKVNQKPTIITIVAVIAVLGAFLLPELSARRFIKNDKTFIGHTMRYVFNDNGINVLDEQAGTTALHAWNNIMNMYETAEYFFMFLGKQSALLIPKRCLSAEDLADFREMLTFQPRCGRVGKPRVDRPDGGGAVRRVRGMRLLGGQHGQGGGRLVVHRQRLRVPLRSRGEGGRRVRGGPG